MSEHAATQDVKSDHSGHLEVFIEKLIFRSRWILASFYMILVATLFLVAIKFVKEFAHFAMIFWNASEAEFVTGVLATNEEMVAHMRIANYTAPIYNISGLAFGKAEVRSRVQGELKPFLDRSYRVGFAARWDQEKQPDFYMDLIEEWNKTIDNAKKDPEIMQRYIDFLTECPLHIDTYNRGSCSTPWRMYHFATHGTLHKSSHHVQHGFGDRNFSRRRDCRFRKHYPSS